MNIGAGRYGGRNRGTPTSPTSFIIAREKKVKGGAVLRWCHLDVSLKLSREGSLVSESEAHTQFEDNRGEITGSTNVTTGVIDIEGKTGDLSGQSQWPEMRRMKEVQCLDVTMLGDVSLKTSREGPQTNLINQRDNSDIGVAEMERSFNMFGEEEEFVEESYKTPKRSWGREKFGVGLEVVAIGVDLSLYADLNVELCSMEGSGLGVVKVGYDVYYVSLPRVETVVIDHGGGSNDG
ncbi:hypothetical protein VNO80_16065 [Phaseolus coccineus]|uniref:Uncharacterized protein n=1 Tax=Phaseolus coccineus TaxID=3886 RepID=A0AAN9MLF5_PHACN